MDEQSKTEQPKIKKTHHKRWLLIGFLALLFLCMAASYGVRTSAYLQMRLNPKLDELGETFGGAFQYERVYAMGMTGIILDQVTFTPAINGAHPVYFDRVIIYPALSGMFYGDFNASRVELKNAVGNWDLSRDDAGDVTWMRSVLQRLNHRKTEEPLVESDRLNGHDDLPEMICESCHFAAVLPQNHSIELTVPSQMARVISLANTEVQLSGDRIHACIQNRGQDNANCFDLTAGGVLWSDRLKLRNVNVENLVLDGMSVEALHVNQVEFSNRESFKFLYVDYGHLELHVTDQSILSAISGDYVFEFNQLEILREFDSNRLGYGVTIIEPDLSQITVYGGYHFLERKLAVTVDAKQFELARFLKNADFSRKLKFDNLPVTGTFRTIVEFSKDKLWLDLSLDTSDGAFTSEMVAKDPLTELNAGLNLQAWLNLKDKTVVTENAYVTLGDIRMDFFLSRQLNKDTGYHIDANVQSQGKSDTFLSSLPKGFVPSLQGYELTGPYRFNIGVAYDEMNLDSLKLYADFELDQVKVVKFDPKSDFERLRGDAFMIRINAATVPITIGPRDPNWVRFYDLPRETAYAFVASEDTKFFTHNGFDIRAIRASLIADLKADKVVRGGSTISQQVVKNLFLNQDKTLSRKFQEAFLTWVMEKNLPKIRIFEFYLNLAHWAKDTYGIRDAAKFYFNKNVNQLSLRESLFLVSILPNPVVFGKQYAENKLSSSRINKMLTVGTFLRDAKRISKEDWDAAVPLIKEGKISDRPRPIIP